MDQQPADTASSGHECTSSDAETDIQSPSNRTGFKKPFKIYENFRSVYKGVQMRKKGVSISYDLAEAAAAAEAASVATVVAVHSDIPTRPDIPTRGAKATPLHSRSPSYTGDDRKGAYSSLDSCLTECNNEVRVTVSHNVGESESKKRSSPVDGNSTDDSGIDSISTPEPKAVPQGSEQHVYSKVSVSSKKKNKMLSECVGNMSESGGTVIKLVDGIDIGESTTEDVGNDSVEKRISLETLSKNDISDIYELTTLLNNTTALLTRNSSLRASLTISVKNPKNGKSNEQTFILPGGNNNGSKATPSGQNKVNSESVWSKSASCDDTDQDKVTEEGSDQSAGLVTMNIDVASSCADNSSSLPSEEEFPRLVKY